MATLGILAGEDGLRLADPRGGGLGDALGRALADLPASAPIVILIHGYRWDARLPGADPNRSLYASGPGGGGPRERSWPCGLGLAGPRDGLCIGFAWPAAAPHLPALIREGTTGFGQVYARAAEAGAALAALIALVRRRAPWRRVDVLAHSLGARVALASLPRLARPPSRILLLGAAEYAGEARALLAAAPQPGPSIYNVTARSNDLFDLLFETFAPRSRPGDHALGRGLPEAPPGWIDLQIDHPATVAWLAARGVAVGAPAARACHWSFYTLPGALAAYRAILRRAPGWDVASLRAEPALALREPRWSRLLGRGAGPIPPEAHRTRLGRRITVDPRRGRAR